MRYFFQDRSNVNLQKQNPSEPENWTYGFIYRSKKISYGFTGLKSHQG